MSLCHYVHYSQGVSLETNSFAQMKLQIVMVRNDKFKMSYLSHRSFGSLNRHSVDWSGC